MFPVDFAFQVVEKYSDCGDNILDPFAGRASSVYAACASGRLGTGIEINPVGWIYGKGKTNPAPPGLVLGRLREIADTAREVDLRREPLPEFFRWCYSAEVRRFLIAARSDLCWRKRSVDTTLMAFLLAYLHGKRGAALSNQLRDGKAMSPAYSVGWWRSKRLTPPDIDPVDFMARRIEWRYAKGRPDLSVARLFLGDCSQVLRKLRSQSQAKKHKPFDLLFTSPPYYGVISYQYDQWLRLWLLGEDSFPTAHPNMWRKKFSSESAYSGLLYNTFLAAAEIMKRGAVVYVRTDARSFTFHTTVAALQTAFPRKRMTIVRRPYTKSTQTALFGDTADKPGEIDLVLQ